MPEHLLTFAMTLPLPRKEVFAFYCDASNLGRITPPELDFQLLTPLPIAMRQGALIDYRLQLFGVPFRWTTEIGEWSPPDGFVDRQKAGPYRSWVHRHTFSDTAEGGTLIADEVRYRLPLLPIGEAALPLVRAELERIFAYRQKAIREILLGDAEI